MFDKEKFFNFNDAVIKKVNVPEWGDFNEFMHVRNMSGKARCSFELDITKAEGDDARLYNMRARLAILCCCDVDGKLLFTDEDEEKLSGMSAGPLEVIFEAAMDINKIGAKDVEEMEKSLEVTPS